MVVGFKQGPKEGKRSSDPEEWEFLKPLHLSSFNEQ